MKFQCHSMGLKMLVHFDGVLMEKVHGIVMEVDVIFDQNSDGNQWWHFIKRVTSLLVHTIFTLFAFTCVSISLGFHFLFFASHSSRVFLTYIALRDEWDLFFSHKFPYLMEKCGWTWKSPFIRRRDTGPALAMKVEIDNCRDKIANSY